MIKIFWKKSNSDAKRNIIIMNYYEIMNDEDI